MTQAGHRPTLERVAARAGVSRATVSRVVNGSTKVAPEHRDAVMRAVRELGYVPNAAARSLVTQRTNSMALVFPEPATRVFSDDPFFPSIVRGVSQELEEADVQLVLVMANSAAGHERIERYAMARHVDGVMMASMHGADPLPMALHRMGIPIVAMERTLGRGNIPITRCKHRQPSRSRNPYRRSVVTSTSSRFLGGRPDGEVLVADLAEASPGAVHYGPWDQIPAAAPRERPVLAWKTSIPDRSGTPAGGVRCTVVPSRCLRR
jgi:transcriptional regulator with XRE-family HTH domain